MAFSEIEKMNIKEKLIVNCEESWSTFGYKKTNIDDLCRKSGISKGAFYLFYISKEDLFCDVIVKAQQRLLDLTKKSLGENPTKYDLASTFKLIYREYIKIPFITETRTPDFIAFMNKLPKEKINEMDSHGHYDVRDIIRKSKVKYKIEEDKGLSALSVLFTPIVNKEDYPWDYLEVFDFMLDTLIEVIFE